MCETLMRWPLSLSLPGISFLAELRASCSPLSQDFGWKGMHTDDTNDVIAFVLVQDMSRIIQLKPYCFEVVRLNIKDF
jgi:hypothetical protein